MAAKTRGREKHRARGARRATAPRTQRDRHARADSLRHDARNSVDLRDPEKRPLKAYAFDPTRGRALGNYMTIDVRYERLEPGPRGKLIEVIDFDATNKRYYRPVDLDDPAILIRSGLDPAESDPQFHQQMVYAVASETIRHFELALGRDIVWSFDPERRPRRALPDLAKGRRRLRIFPHAMQEANAYYSRRLRALVFGYFPASSVDAGSNVPGQTVFTCLSHDIVAHETTHALVDSQRDQFMVPSTGDAPAFHEAFADLVALFQHFSFKDALLSTVQQSGGLIYRPELAPEREPGGSGALIQAELPQANPLVGLAQQFGEALGTRKALRSALGTPPNVRQLATATEPHERGAILVAAVFDAFFTIYVRRTRDVMRIAGLGSPNPRLGALPTELAARLAEMASQVAQEVLTICIRALDYCPPVDIRFGDFLRALITADYDIRPDDPDGYRLAFIDAFRSRGIVPDGALSFSEELLRWAPPEVYTGRSLPPCEGLEFDVFKLDPEAQRQARERNALVLTNYAKRHARALRLSTDGDLRILPKSLHAVHRIRPDGELRFDMVTELTQFRAVDVDPKTPSLGPFLYRGGTTLIVGSDGYIRYVIAKPLGDSDRATDPRLAEQRAYIQGRMALLGHAPYVDDLDLSLESSSLPLDFRWIHRGY